MVLNNTQTLAESMNFVDLERPYAMKLPKKLRVEIEAFKQRNALVVVGSRIKGKKPIYSCCPRCLKAFVLKKAGEMELGEIVEGMLVSLFDCEWGHNGYYMDGEDLRKV